MGSNRKNIGERSEPSGGLGRGKAPPPLSPPQATSRFSSLANFFFLFPPMRNLVSSYSAPYRFLLQSPSFFLLFWSRLSNFSTNSPGDACYAAEKLMVRRNLHCHLKKHENGARHCIFNLVHLIAHQTLEPFSSKHFAVEDYYPITLSWCC